MPSIAALLRRLGNDGAVANARVLLETREREAWLVAGLARRLEQRDAAAAAHEQPSATAAA